MEYIDNKKLEISTISVMRVIATLMVVLVHFGQSIPLPDMIHIPIIFGAKGVIIFFVISGYLISASLDKCDNKIIFYKNMKKLIKL